MVELWRLQEFREFRERIRIQPVEGWGKEIIGRQPAQLIEKFTFKLRKIQAVSFDTGGIM